MTAFQVVIRRQRLAADLTRATVVIAEIAAEKLEFSI